MDKDNPKASEILGVAVCVNAPEGGNPDKERVCKAGPPNGKESYRRPVTLAAYIKDVERRMGELYTPFRAALFDDARAFLARQEKGRGR
jgi:hypothetical protein